MGNTWENAPRGKEERPNWPSPGTESFDCKHFRVHVRLWIVAESLCERGQPFWRDTCLSRQPNKNGYRPRCATKGRLVPQTGAVRPHGQHGLNLVETGGAARTDKVLGNYECFFPGTLQIPARSGGTNVQQSIDSKGGKPECLPRQNSGMKHAILFLKVSNTRREQLIFANARAMRLKVTSTSKLLVEGEGAAPGDRTRTRAHTAKLSAPVRKVLPLRLKKTRTPLIVPRPRYNLL